VEVVDGRRGTDSTREGL
jgi:hypothetical protein